MLCHQSRAARDLELEGKLPTEAELALFVDDISDTDPDQGGVDTNAFPLKMVLYKNRNPELNKARTKLKRHLDLKPTLQGGIEHQADPKRKKRAVEKWKRNNKTIKEAEKWIAREEGITGDSAMDALLDQKDAYVALFHGEKPPVEGSNAHLNIKFYDNVCSMWYVKLSPASLGKLKRNATEVVWVNIREKWALGNHKPIVIAYARACKDGFTPATAMGQAAGIFPEGPHGEITEFKISPTGSEHSWVIHQWSMGRHKKNVMLDDGREEMLFACKYVTEDDYKVWETSRKEATIDKRAKKLTWKSKYIVESKLLDVIEGNDLSARQTNIQKLKNLIKPIKEGKVELQHYHPKTGKPFSKLDWHDDQQVMGLRVESSRNGTETWFSRRLCGPGLKQTAYNQESIRWVEENFQPQYLELIRQKNTEGTQGFVTITPGDPREDLPPFLEDTAPQVHYLQGDTRTCMICAMCSALHYVGLVDSAEALYAKTDDLIERPDQCKLIMDFMQTKLPQLIPRRLSGRHNMLDKKQWTVGIKLIRLASSDGGIGHSAAIVGGYIFDSTCPRALPLTKKSLDWSCMGQFEMVFEGFHFLEEQYQVNKLVTKSLMDTIPEILCSSLPPSFTELKPAAPEGTPEVKYVQRTSSEDQCIIMSLASGLFYLGLTSLAEALMKEKYSILQRGYKRMPQAVVEFMEKSALTPTKFKKGTTNLLKLSPYPKMLRVFRLNNKISTTPLVIIGGWIFDSRSEYALPLTTLNLKGCSHDGQHCDIKDGYQFCESNRKRDKLITQNLIDVLPVEMRHLFKE